MSSRKQTLVQSRMTYIDEFDAIVAFERLACLELELLIKLLGHCLLSKIASIFTGFDNLLSQVVFIDARALDVLI